jgi:hypothetical protein
MGFFDRFGAHKNSPPAAAPGDTAPAPSGGGGVLPQLAAARGRLEAGDLPGALAIYEQVLAVAGERADVLVAVSGDLGVHGHVGSVIELVAPRYDAQRHGPATGLNILQAYLAVREATAAQHVLDILFSLNRPELEDRLHGFSNAIAELLEAERRGLAPLPGGPDEPVPARISLVSLSKPVWFYGLEPLADEILPPKASRLRRVAFAQLARPGLADADIAKMEPADELGRLSRALPLWLAETFCFSTAYASLGVVGLLDDGQGGKNYAPFGTEWTAENLRQLAATADAPIDYVLTGALRARDGGHEVLLRVWEMKKLRERKTFTARWTPADADAELAKLNEQIRVFMEWTPETRGLAWSPPASPSAWLELLDASLGLFLLEKKLLPKNQTPVCAVPPAAGSEAAALARITLRARAGRLGLAVPDDAGPAFSSPLVEHARELAV